MQNLSIEKVKFDFSKFKDIEKEIQKVLPEKVPEYITFTINTNAKVANAIRRTLLDEIKAKALDAGEVETNDIYILKDELRENIGLIPIDQTIPIGAKFSLAVENNKTNILPVKSRQIRTSIKNPFNSRIELCSLNPGKRVQIKNISVVEGRGRNHAKFSLVSTVGYKMLDYMNVYYLNEKNKEESYTLTTEQVQKITKTKNVMDKKILIIPTKEQKSYMSEKLKARLKYYDIIVDPDPKLKLKELHNYQSTEYIANKFQIKIRTLGTIDPLKLLEMCYGTILQELNFIYNMKSFAVDVSESKGVFHFHIKNSSYTLGEAINYTVYEMNPDIPLCNITKHDPVSNTIIVNIKHIAAEKIFKSAVKHLIEIFERFISSIPRTK